MFAVGLDAHEPARALAHRIGTESAVDRILLDPARDPAQAAEIDGWIPPRLPIGGGALIARGIAPGPDVAKALQEVERTWVAEGFPDANRVHAIADQIVSKFQRARQ